MDPNEFSYYFNIIAFFYNTTNEMYIIMILDIKQIVANMKPDNYGANYGSNPYKFKHIMKLNS